MSLPFRPLLKLTQPPLLESPQAPGDPTFLASPQEASLATEVTPQYITLLYKRALLLYDRALCDNQGTGTTILKDIPQVWNCSKRLNLTPSLRQHDSFHPSPVEFHNALS